jgi:hypothetical protein
MKLFCLIIITAFIFAACESADSNKLDKDFLNAKSIDITTKYGVFKIKMPSCFEEINDYHFSWTNEHRYECEDYNLYFSVDVLSSNELSQKTSGSANNSRDALIYLAKLRSSDFYQIKTGFPAKSFKASGCQQYSLFQYGKWYQQNEDMVFWSSAMECKDNFYITQFICLRKDFNVLEKHFEMMLKSIEVL